MVVLLAVPTLAVLRVLFDFFLVRLRTGSPSTRSTGPPVRRSNPLTLSVGRQPQNESLARQRSAPKSIFYVPVTVRRLTCLSNASGGRGWSCSAGDPRPIKQPERWRTTIPARTWKSEERRGGKECVSTVKSRGARDH